MYLKTLTLKGFKSFADPTTIELEPGVTVVVGPNGSGKSNVVDAVAWVLGAQGPSVVRSAKMDDVIFAGTQKRPALGRAEVSLTIDNSSRRLPIDFSEVTVTRTLFRTGESEYAINGAPCRLLDVQELLSDSGVGRQQHVIIGQGQLDAVLASRPEDRRAVVEEAAGVLKYRRRRERAERRLESSEAGLARLQDLAKEVQRQLKPLERQAAAAARHDDLSAERHGLRLHLARTELGDLHERLASAERRRAELDTETAITGADLARTWAALSLAEESSVEEPAEELRNLALRIDAERQRARQVLALCRERRRATAALAAMLGAGHHVASVEAEADGVAGEIARANAEFAALEPEWTRLASVETEWAADEQELLERLAELEPPPPGPAPEFELAAVRVKAADLRERLVAARERHARTSERAAAVEARREEDDHRLTALVAAMEALVLDEAAAEAEAERLAHLEEAQRSALQLAEEALHSAEDRAHAGAARVEALELALDEARARAGLERLAALPGVLGTLPDVVEVEANLGLAFEAALEWVLAGVLVAGHDHARAALLHLRRDGFGGSVLPLSEPGGVTESSRTARTPVPPEGTEALRAGVSSPEPAVEALLDRLLEGVLLCRGGIEAALDVATTSPGHVIVTPEGDRFSDQGWRLGAGRAGATRAALEAAKSRSEVFAREVLEHAAATGASAQELDRVRGEASAAARWLDSARSDRRRRAEQIAELSATIDGLLHEQKRVASDHEDAGHAAARAAEELADVEERADQLERAESEVSERRQHAAAARRSIEARARELGALRRDLEVRAATLEERRASLIARHEALVEELVAARDGEALAGERRASYARDDRALGRLAREIEGCLDDLDRAAQAVAVDRERRAQSNRESAARLQSLKARKDALDRVIAGLRDRRQRLEIEHTEMRVRREATLASLSRDLGLGPSDLGETPLPHLGAEVDAAARLAAVEEELRRIGAVNPLARDELSALEERSTFLDSQLEDVRAARRELGQVISSVDREIVEIFSAAYADVSRHFTDLFTTLFPGGTGRLSLTAPDDPLSTGIEIEARPAGRNVRRLSLLSGGERSLVAMAFLFAVFRSRPSPFYLMDEVEAALDEVNLRRFLDLVDEFRDEAQLIIVTHQKRTMEAADALYGVSLQPGGSSRIVSEKVRGRPASVMARTLEVQ